MKLYYLIFKVLMKQIISEAINALAEFIRQVLRALFFDEEPNCQSQPIYEEPFE